MSYEETLSLFCVTVSARVWMRSKLEAHRMEDLPKFLDVDATWVDERANIGAGTLIFPGCSIEGEVTVGKRCRILSGARIISSKSMAQEGYPKKTVIGDDCEIWPGTYVNVEAEDGVTLGLPHIKNSRIGRGSVVGALAELNRVVMGKLCKAAHNCYLGDTVLGDESNVGAGFITANFDGTKKYKTVFGRECFLGVNASSVAPNGYPEGTTIAAGSTIPKNFTAHRPFGPFSLLLSRMKKVSVKPGRDSKQK